MKLAVLGATGQTGQNLVRQALQQGHMVTALVRTPSKLTVEHDNLKVIEANIFSEESLSAHFKDQDAVISCLGFSPAFFSYITGYTDSMKAAVNAMRQAKVNRVIAITSWYTEPKEFLTHEGYFVPDSSGYPVGNSVGRGDVARFMLSLLNSNTWVKKGVVMTTK